MKTLKSVLIIISLMLLAPASGHEGHDKAFGTNSAVSTSQKITVLPEGQESMGIKSQLVKLGFVDQTLQATGRVVAAENRLFDITATVPGVVKSVSAKLGDRVSAGKTLAIVHSGDIASVLTKLLEDRAQIQADITKTRTQYQADIAVLSKEAMHFDSEFKREEQLFKEGVTSRKSFIDAQHAYETATVKLESSKTKSVQDVALLQKQLITTTEAVKSQLKVMGLPGQSVDKAIRSNRVISEIPIVSPVSGIIIQRDVTQGETLSSEKKIFSIVNLSPIWVIVDIFQEQIPLVKLGQEVQLRTASGKNLLGRISDIGTTIDPHDRAIHIRVVTENRSGELKPEMFVNAKIVVATGKRQQVTAPASAVIDDSGRSLVYVQYGNEFQPVIVKVGARTSEEVEILDGLFEGDHLVIHGAKQLRSQSMLTASGAKESQDDHDHHERVKANDSPNFLQTLLLGIGVGIIFTVSAVLLLRLKKRAIANRSEVSKATEKTEDNSGDNSGE